MSSRDAGRDENRGAARVDVCLAAHPQNAKPHKPGGTMSDDSARPPRFPYVAALLCAACIGAAAWTWKRYSYRHDVTPARLYETEPENDAGVLGRYARVEGVVVGTSGIFERGGVAFYELANTEPLRGRLLVAVAAEGEDSLLRPNDRASFTGRVRVRGDADELIDPERPAAWSWVPGRRTQFDRFLRRLRLANLNALRWYDSPVLLDATASRFTGASIAGLVVGAMGLFVFTVALRHWLGERRKPREEARA